ncbi:hypothetical protein NFIA_087350 [Paecilomyces variotii No. 5]|uniref:Uncharacterized protein n=1 Tax=Byssochlamys spectabilis (strain No. 5 / NBRC 109023) TaxID=1356009 RepID=V5FXS2_BYSSN|nr:hypothetical protein NFIA_087350 [Paecilomyces variotii No. 5]
MDSTISPEAADIQRRKLLEQLAAQNGTKHQNPDGETHEPARQGGNEDEYSRSRQGKFRFKSSKSKPQSKRDAPSEEDGEDRRHHRHHRRRHHHGRHRHSSKREKTDRERSASPYSLHNRPLSPNTAFRESLFDALGDDEGAAFWESVYGQPIHTYPNREVPKGPDGELEQMDEEEYAAYVRAKMWEKTHEGVMEERERLREERARAKERDQRRRRETSERMQFERAMEESLRRGQARKKMKAWKTAWEEYRRSWDELNSLASSSSNKDTEKQAEKPENQYLRNLIFWPVESGKRRDISSEAVEEFMRHAPASSSPDSSKSSDVPPSDLLATLKAERIRWHPDKIQHRYSALGIDESVMRSVTEVFQIIDRLWSEERRRRGET